MKRQKFNTTSIDGNVYSYEIMGLQESYELSELDNLFEQSGKLPGKVGDRFQFAEHTIAAYGDYNNLPQLVQAYITENSILPEILKKQVRYLYGYGPFLYRTEFDKNGHRRRIPVEDQHRKWARLFNWLASWQQNGIKQSFEQFAKRVIMEYYYTEGIPVKYRLARSSRIGGRMPVAGLEHEWSTRFRLATPSTIDNSRELRDSDLTHVLVGDWMNAYRFDMDIYPRFNPEEPLAHANSFNYTKDMGYGEDIYSHPTFFKGLKEWIKGSNLNPKYINSYLKNSLNAKLHVLIPDTWIESKAAKLREICDLNKDREQTGKSLITEYSGLTGIGTEYSEGLVDKLIEVKIQQAANVMSGEGKNQGKMFVSRRHRTEFGVEDWEFKEIPTKYKEFIDSLLNYEKQAMKSILAGKGLDPSISSVSNEGVFQNSGSNAYYNYMIYLNSLTYAEDFCTEDINRALRINFPSLAKQGIQLGFYREAPQRTEEIPNNERIEKNTQ